MQMRTTVRLDEGLLAQAKAEAARHGKTLTALMEEGLRLAIASRGAQPRRRKVVLPVSRQSGGTFPGIDIDNSAELLDIMDGYFDPGRR